tara:strand:+ start:928 stop:1116 length:189 start_codon:yes stop_codon:yes gene_type:complete
MKLALTFDDVLALDEQLVCFALSEMFNVDIEFDEDTVVLQGNPADILCLVAFNVLPLETIEA